MICSIVAPLGLCSLITFGTNGGKGTFSDQSENPLIFFIKKLGKLD